MGFEGHILEYYVRRMPYPALLLRFGVVWAGIGNAFAIFVRRSREDFLTDDKDYG